MLFHALGWELGSISSSGGAGAGHNLCKSWKKLMYLGSGYKYFTGLLKTINVAPVGSLVKRGDDR